MLELQGATVLYGGFTAVEDITFEVPDGRFVAVVGPTGCGKSSLLNLVAGLLAPAAGTVLKGGADALTAIIGGSTDATMGFYEHTIRTQTQGKFIQMIATCDLYPAW